MFSFFLFCLLNILCTFSFWCSKHKTLFMQWMQVTGLWPTFLQVPPGLLQGQNFFAIQRVRSKMQVPPEGLFDRTNLVWTPYKKNRQRHGEWNPHGYYFLGMFDGFVEGKQSKPEFPCDYMTCGMCVRADSMVTISGNRMWRVAPKFWLQSLFLRFWRPVPVW